MAITNSIGKAASEAAEKAKKTHVNTKGHWEQGDLKEIEKISKRNAEWDKEKSKTGWTNPQTGQKFSADHYKENYDNDMKSIQRVQNEIKKRKLAKSLKERDERISRDIKMKKRDKIDDYLED